MSRARQILPGTTYLLTRRCLNRHLFLRPSKFTNQVMLYCLAVAAERYEMSIHQVCVMSNHYHLIATDVEGNLPAFMRYLNEFVAKTMNAHLGRWECFFRPGSYSAVQLTDEQSALEKLAYSITNPVEAGLVSHSQQWPGLCTLPQDIGTSRTVKRPDKLFRKEGPMPESASLTLSPLPDALNSSPETQVARLSALVEESETKAHNEMQRQRRRFLGRQSVRKQDPFDTPVSLDPRRQINPRVAGRDRERRKEALRQLKQFLLDYRVAWLAFRDGVRDVLFPEGTYAMRLHHGVCCGPGSSC
jgi:putative transposase